MQFIVMAPNSWQGPWMNRQQLFSRIAHSHQVIYSNGPLMSWDLGKERFKSASWKGRLDSQGNVDIHQPSKLTLRVPSFPWLDTLAKKGFAHSIEKHFNRDEQTCLYLFHPKFSDYLDSFHYDVLVYHAYDDFSKQGNYNQEKQAKETKLIERADVVIASSNSIARHLAQLHPEKEIHVVPNGVDFEHFSTSQAEPDDLKCIAKPRVGYTGSINRKVDLPLLEKLSNLLPEIQFVMIGGIGVLGEQQALFDALQSKENIHFLGQKSVSEIAAYMQHMDANTMLYKADQSTWAASGYPLKLHEYLATGKPAISAGIEAVYEFSDVLAIPESVEGWVTEINLALSSGKQPDMVKKRIKVAAENTWDSRVESILALVENANKCA